MNLNLTSKLWTWTTIPLAGLCLALGLSLMRSIEQSRRDGDFWAAQIEEMKALTDVLPIVRDGAVTDGEWRAAETRFHASAGRFRQQWPADPRILALIQATERVVNDWGALRKAPRNALWNRKASELSERINSLSNDWARQRADFNSRLGLALSGPLEKWRDAALLSILACIASFLLLVLHRTYRRELRERQATERQLQQSEARYRRVFENAIEGLYQTSPDGRIMSANPALLQMLGLDSEEALRIADVGRDLYVRPSERGRLTAKLLQEGELRNEEIELRVKHGKTITVLENARVVRAGNGAAIYFEGSLLDITGRKRAQQAEQERMAQIEEAKRQLEEQARQLLSQSLELALARDRAVQISRLKTDFLAKLSGEIRTPMQGVISMSQLLMESPLSQQQREFVGVVRQSAESLLATLADIAEYSRIESGHFELRQEPVSLRAAIEQVLEQMAPEAERKGLELPCLVRPDVPDAVVGDSARLQQILASLLSNAIKFTDSGEVVTTVSLARESSQDVWLRFQVEDSGMGIPPEAFARLFEPFARAAGRRPTGTGLGLAISKHLAEKMGGQIGVESEPGQGSLFWFLVHFPKQEAVPGAGTIDLSPLHGRRVLIVDDVASARGAIAELAHGWKMRVTSAADGHQAMELIRGAIRNGSPFDFAVVDFDMPGMSGLDLAETILDELPSGVHHILLLAPHSQRQWRDEPLLEGIRKVLTKPLRESDLLQCLRQCLESEIRPALVQLGTHVGAAESQPEPGHPGASVRRVLIAEDNKVNQKVALRLVERMGLAVDVVSSGAEAIRAAEHRHYDLILMDCQMPEVHGYAATAAIRALPGEASRTPIVAMTANAMQGDRERCLEAGMDDYISKPVNFETLRAVMGRWMDLDAIEPPQKVVSGSRG